ncbi:hypothetical protein BP5796_02741 [Coleophoma crateriformis]|uniref:Uncharacterized protein n=1 Tax=Coleophoma crateriformis TaxID=565419 RepID=A0A3D8SZ52_9HELO|nr:hypothetical protein BP5796_02741 [Coleophoma crateriformis]
MPDQAVSSFEFTHINTRIFWYLAALFLTQLAATLVFADQDAVYTHAAFGPIFTRWLRPFIVTRQHQTSALTIYSIILFFQLLEGLWVLQEERTLLRLFFYYFPVGTWLLFWPVWVVLAAVLTLCCLVTVVVGFGILFIQGLCLAEIAYLPVLDDVDVPGEEVGTEQGFVIGEVEEPRLEGASRMEAIKEE